MSKYRKSWIIILSICSLVFTSLALINEKEDVNITVKTQELKNTVITKYVSASGKLAAYRSRELGASTYAIADKVYVTVGDSVKKGQLLISFSANDSPSLSIGIDASNIGISELGQTAAQLFNSKLIESPYASMIVAPFDGIVTAINIEEGEQTVPLKSCIEVTDFSRMQAILHVKEDDVSSLDLGMTAKVSGEALNQVCTGVLTQISPIIKTSISLSGGEERYCEAILEISDPNNNLRPGASIISKINCLQVKGALSIPYTAIGQDENNKEYVYVLTDDNHAKMCYIDCGEDIGTEVEILAGLQTGDTLILNNPAELYPGVSVVSIESGRSEVLK